MEPLTQEQQHQAEERIELALRVARRFRRPFWMTPDEWQAEALHVLVEAVATQERNDNFEAHLCVRLRYRRMQLNRSRPPMRRLVSETLPARREAPALDDALEGLSDADRDMLRERVMGTDWETLGATRGCSGRTVRRWFRRTVARLRMEAAR